MARKITQVVWTRQARESLNAILDYRYKDIPTARRIVRKDIIGASKEIVFAEQYQRDEIFQEYRRIIVRDYKILYKEQKGVVYILNVICTKANTETS
ncbi:type II toxin-antitoxin system RelE/ParE family toxin [Sinomicrobium weinanense]|uniref:Type II toxin-antitoxin system RelE/ParE family toxin n=1 Tax=Sinomicrobium weinanense TaxID=2842200 RepID=A0A926Q1L9_9FLAO|nr:type II toxin-antitoxin system RelE/ParE family toxin [Sinomicrobium weinanense]MBC9795862.1 type II toxin-antitoxin system RelE/ParE family toxin [Sinomicrobium weinanense]MBU3125382.1 type II toxin-antitoxin system RelE/ParE family toxin [Sinomicrobium weinanense]